MIQRYPTVVGHHMVMVFLYISAAAEIRLTQYLQYFTPLFVIFHDW